MSFLLNILILLRQSGNLKLRMFQEPQHNFICLNMVSLTSFVNQKISSPEFPGVYLKFSYICFDIWKILFILNVPLNENPQNRIRKAENFQSLTFYRESEIWGVQDVKNPIIASWSSAGRVMIYVGSLLWCLAKTHCPPIISVINMRCCVMKL